MLRGSNQAASVLVCYNIPMKVTYKKRDGVLVFETKEGRQTSQVAFRLEDKKPVEALFTNYPVLFDLVDTNPKENEFYLYTVGDLIKKGGFYSNLEGEYMPTKGFIVELDYTPWGIRAKITASNLIVYLLASLPNTQASTKEITDAIPSEAVVIGPGSLLANIPNILESKLIILYKEADEFKSKLGVSSIESKNSVSISPTKVETATALIGVYSLE